LRIVASGQLDDRERRRGRHRDRRVTRRDRVIAARCCAGGCWPRRSDAGRPAIGTSTARQCR
jgi:hypothetical protein